MKTKHSVNLLKERPEPCDSIYPKGCRILTQVNKGCGSCACPFYKPKNCGDWIRVEDEEGINLIPQEEYYPARQKSIEEAGPAVWRISRARA